MRLPYSHAFMDAMRVHALVALGSVTLAFGACGIHEPAQPNGTGNYAEIPANVQDMVPDDVFPMAKQFAKDCENLKDLASCNYLGWMLTEGMDPPVQYAGETAKEPTDGDQYRVGLLPEYSSVPKDPESANALFAAACNAGWSSACVSLVRQGVADDPGGILTDACAQGEVDACAMLGDAAQNGGFEGLSHDEIVQKLDEYCNSGRRAACLAQAAASKDLGKSTQPALKNPHLLTIRASGDRARIRIYTDHSDQARAVASRAREAFGDNVDITFEQAQGATGPEWLEIAPALLALAEGVPGDASITLRRDTLNVASAVPDNEERAAVRTALERLAGEDFQLTALLSQADIDSAETVRDAEKREEGQ